MPGLPVAPTVGARMSAMVRFGAYADKWSAHTRFAFTNGASGKRPPRAQDLAFLRLRQLSCSSGAKDPFSKHWTSQSPASLLAQACPLHPQE